MNGSRHRAINESSFADWYEQGRDSWTNSPVTNAISSHAVFYANRAKVQQAGIVDVGCGRGFQTVDLHRSLSSSRTVGIDVLDVWAQGDQTNIEFVETDFLMFLAEPFGLVFDNGCFHHQAFDDMATWLEHVDRLLVDEGVFVLTLFLAPSGATRAITGADGRQNWWFTESDAIEMLESRFFLLDSETIPRNFEYQGESLSYLLLALQKRKR